MACRPPQWRDWSQQPQHSGYQQYGTKLTRETRRKTDAWLDYINGVKYIEKQMLTQPNGLTNDVRYYIYVVPI